MGGSHHETGRRKNHKKRFLMGNSTIQDKWDDQEKDGRILSRRMHYRFWEYEDGGDELGIERNGAPLEGGQGPEWAVALYVDGRKWLQ